MVSLPPVEILIYELFTFAIRERLLLVLHQDMTAIGEIVTLIQDALVQTLP